MTARELIERYHIRLLPNDMIAMPNAQRVKDEGAFFVLLHRKPEIVAELKRMNAAGEADAPPPRPL